MFPVLRISNLEGVDKNFDQGSDNCVLRTPYVSLQKVLADPAFEIAVALSAYGLQHQFPQLAMGLRCCFVSTSPLSSRRVVVIFSVH